MNIDNFLDPMGGQERSTMNNGGLLIAGFFMDKSLFQKYVSNPLLRNEARSLHSKRASYAAKRVRAKKASGQRYMPTKPGGVWYGGTGGGPLPSGREKWGPHFTEQYNTRGYRAADMSQLRARQKTFNKFAGRIRGFGWAFIGAAAFDIAESALTPGISKVAAKAENAMFMNENPLDGGATYTMRQRSLQALHDSQMSVARNVLGQESNYLHS